MTDPIEASSSVAVDRGMGMGARLGTKKVYSAPTLMRWGAVEDLTGTGNGIADEAGNTASGGGG